jgi:putative DNA primase/helicase
VIHGDGTLYRFSTNGKRMDQSGWYVLHDDGDLPAGAFGCWRSGLAQTWCSKDTQAMTPAERKAHQQRMQAIAQQREADKAERQHDAAMAAAQRWEAALLAPADHPYLAKKGVHAHGTRVEPDGFLIVPMRDTNGKLWNIERINPANFKDKKGLLGGRRTGLYYSIGKPKGVLIVCEGFATGASIHEATGDAVAVAFNAGNLREVAQALHSKYPRLRLILAADDDAFTDGNPGITKASEAARAVGGDLTKPDFGEQRSAAETDFNDLHQRAGLEAVKACIGAAAPVAQAPVFPPLEDADDSDAAPEPLRAPLPPAEHYPVEALGNVLGGAARALHESIKAPLALCAQSVLAAASLAAQAHYDVRLPWGQRKPLALFLLTVGESGERKSAVDDVVLGAAKAREKTEMAEYQLAMEEYESAMAAWNKATEAARTSATQGKKGTATAQQIREAVELAGDKPTAPIAPLRFVTDPTAEGLYKLLAMSQPSVALFSDEGGLLIGGHALNGDNFLKTITRWSKMWDGAPFDRVRAGDGIGILYGRRMALHQLAQGDVMVKLLSDRLANGQGLLARCLVAWPESTIGTRHTEAFEWAGDRRELKRLFGVLSSLMEAAPRTSDHSEQELDPIELPLSPEATAMALQAGNRFEALMTSGNDLCELRDRTAKALENACRIAGVLVAIEQGMAARQIEADHLGRALVLVQWYLAEALRIRGAAAVPQAVQDAEALSRWLQGRGIAMFRTHAALNAGPAQLRNKARLMAAIEQLVETGYLVANPAGTEVEGVKARKSWRVLHHVV